MIFRAITANGGGKIIWKIFLAFFIEKEILLKSIKINKIKKTAKVFFFLKKGGGAVGKGKHKKIQ